MWIRAGAIRTAAIMAPALTALCNSCFSNPVRPTAGKGLLMLVDFTEQCRRFLVFSLVKIYYVKNLLFKTKLFHNIELYK
jgi:hypothetical protein